MNIRLLPFSSRRGYDNMALDEALLLSGTPSLRFYTWQRPCVSLGCFQKSKEINLAYLEEQEIDLVRRITGGKGVYHEKELTYSIILPEVKLPGSIPSSYRLIGDALLQGLKKAGLAVYHRTEPDRRRAAANCFQAAGWFEIYIQDKKLVGNAQMRQKGIILQQGSILMDLDEKKWQNCFSVSPEEKTRGFTAVNRELALPLSPEELAAYLAAGFRETLRWTWTSVPLDGAEETKARKLAEQKYTTRRWNYSR